MKKRFQQRWSLNLALLIVVIALFFLATYDQDTHVVKPRLLSDYLPTPIDELRIEKPGKQTINLLQVDDHWQMQKPYQARADRNMVERLLAIGRLKISNIIDNDSIDIKHTGLEQPLARVTFNDMTITFGAPQPVGQQRYIRLGKEIMLVADQLADQLKTTSITYVDRQLVPAGGSIKQLVINGQEIDLTSDTSPLNQWLGMKASWLSRAPKLPENAVSVNITLQDNHAIHYLAERRENDIVLTNPDNSFEYHLPAHTAQSLMIDFPADEEPARNTNQPPATQ